MNFKFNNEFYHDIIDIIAAALEARDFYTCGHSTRVADMSYKLGSFLNLTNDQLEILHIAGHLHDIGKIGIPDAILNKKSRLTDEEWILMKTHPQIGYNILSKSENLSYISKIILHHHERYDGKGYPDNLNSSQIPFEARIIAVCDSIDAMKSTRPYRKLLTDSECRAEILKNSSLMYDPNVVDCLMLHWDEIVTYYFNSNVQIS